MPLIFRELHIEVSSAVEVARVEEISGLAESEEHIQGLRPWKSGWAIEGQAKRVTPPSLLLISFEIRLAQPRCRPIRTEQHVEVAHFGEVFSRDAFWVQVNETTKLIGLTTFEETILNFSDLDVGGSRPLEKSN